MAQRGFKMGPVLVFIAVMCACSSAQQPNCQPPLVSLQPCLAYIMSNSSTPPLPCCTQLAGLVQSQAQCLCTFLNAAPQLPFNMNRTQAITLPGACNIQVPPLSQCNVPSGPSVPGVSSGPLVPAAGSPQGGPAPASPETPSDAGSQSPSAPSTPSTGGVPPSKGGSKASPTTGQQSSSAAGSTTKLASSLFFFLLVASVLSSF